MEEDKENFHSKVLNKLGVLIKEQQQLNQNTVKLIALIKKKYDCNWLEGKIYTKLNLCFFIFVVIFFFVVSH